MSGSLSLGYNRLFPPGYLKRYTAGELAMNGGSNQMRFHFSLRLLLIFVVLAAISVTATQWLHMMIHSRPLDVAIEEFEDLQYAHYEKLPPLTSSEVIEFLKSDDAMIQQSPARAKSIFRQISITKRVPSTLKFDMVTYRSGRNPGIDAVIIRMVITEGDFAHSVDVRTIEATTEMQPDMGWEYVARSR